MHGMDCRRDVVFMPVHSHKHVQSVRTAARTAFVDKARESHSQEVRSWPGRDTTGYLEREKTLHSVSKRLAILAIARGVCRLTVRALESWLEKLTVNSNK